MSPGIPQEPAEGLQLWIRHDTGGIMGIQLDGQSYGIGQIPLVQLLMLQRIAASLKRIEERLPEVL